MKEITRINLASLPYNIDIEAKKTLEKYCLEIEQNLGADADAMKEIELRMTELLAERKVIGETVVSMEDVNVLKEQLGKPDDFADDSYDKNNPSQKDPLNEEAEKPVKRVMRDVNNRMLGGVCSGLAAYFKIDSVFVRAVALLLLAVSFGAMAPVYLLLWLIIPPALTAADRLEMAGRPVTLESIQKESSLPQNNVEPLLLVFIRFFTAGVLIFGSLATLALMAKYTGSGFLNYVAMQAPWAIALTASVILSGVLFAIMLSVLAYALITKKFTKRLGMVLVTIIVIGLTSFSVGAFGLRGGDYTDSVNEALDQNMITKTIDGATLQGLEELSVNAPAADVSVHYRVSATDRPGVELSYDRRSVSNQPKVNLERQGGRLVVKIEADDSKCMGGTCLPVQVDITGPLLTKLINTDSRLTYTTGSQQEIIVDVSGSGSVMLFNESGVVNNLVINARDSASVVANNLAASGVKADLREASWIALGNVKLVAIEAADVCRADDQKVRVTYHSAKEIKLNGEVVKEGADKPCFVLEKVNDSFGPTS